MRYYDIKITDPATNAVVKEYTSFVNGVTDPGALDVEMDIPVAFSHTPNGSAYVRVWGIGLPDIGQASNYNPTITGQPGKNIAVYGGMQKGLPLANPAQSGLLVSGTIQQAFGNWVGTDMTLDLIFTYGDLVVSQNANMTVNWVAGTAMSVMIANTLKTVFPTYRQKINISPNLVLPHDEVGFYGTITQFATYLNTVSRDIIGANPAGYPGVRVLVQNNTIIVDDATTAATPIQIAFNDMIGQVTWKGPYTVSMMCVMRADVQVGAYIKMPPGQVTTTEQSYAQYRDSSTFQGVFQVNSVRHVGRARNPDGQAWATIIEASAQLGPQASVGGSGGG